MANKFSELSLPIRVAIVLFGVFVGIRWYSKVETPKGRSTVQEPRPIQAANALDMVRDVKANEVAFESAWEGKRPKITGRVVDVQASVNDGRLLWAKGTHSFKPRTCLSRRLCTFKRATPLPCFAITSPKSSALLWRVIAGCSDDARQVDGHAARVSEPR